jgi:hypothetical protein
MIFSPLLKFIVTQWVACLYNSPSPAAFALNRRGLTSVSQHRYPRRRLRAYAAQGILYELKSVVVLPHLCSLWVYALALWLFDKLR